MLASILALCMVFGTAVTAMADDAAADSVNNDVVYEVVTVDVDDLLNELAYRPAMLAAAGNFYGDRLSGQAKTVYNDMLSYFEDIDNGTGDCISKYTADGLSGNSANQDVQDALAANLMDHTELLNWFGKGPGNSISYVTGTAGDGSKTVYTYFPVISDYRVAGSEQKDTYSFSNGSKSYSYWKIDANKNNDRTTALAKAAEIVANASGSDYEKVRYFNEAICNLTTYDFPALDDGIYDDTYQMINAFNGKPVVCEGYAKAFKYLCDESNIGCLIIEGHIGSGTGAGNHMWNYVELDGNWYLVDVTNNDGSDESMVNTPGDFTENLLAIGSNNPYYSLLGYDPLYYTDGTSVPTPPAVTLSTEDYVQLSGDKVNVAVESSTSKQVVLKLTMEDPSTALPVVAQDDVTVTPAAEIAGFKQETDKITIDFTKRLDAGTYTVTIKNNKDYHYNSVSFEVPEVDKYAAPTIAVAYNADHTSADITISNPNNAGTIKYTVNGGAETVYTDSFTVDTNTPDHRLTKQISAYVESTDEDFQSSDKANQVVTLVADPDSFHVVVTPVAGLTGTIAADTVVASMEAKNVPYSLDVMYNLESGSEGSFGVDGDKIVANGDVAPGSYVVYVSARPIVDSGNLDSGDPSNLGIGYGEAVIVINSQPTSGGGSSGGGGSSSGGSKLNNKGSVSTGSTGGARVPVSPAAAGKEAGKSAENAIKDALANGSNTAVAPVVIRNGSSIGADALKAVKDAVDQAAAGTGVNVTPVVWSDVVRNGVVQSRMYIDPAKYASLTGDIKLGVELSAPSVSTLFDKYFSNNIRIVKFEHTGPFGMAIEVAVKLDLTNMNTENLYFYSYDAATNVYTPIANPMYYIDTNGYLHFTVSNGGHVIISDGPLARK